MIDNSDDFNEHGKRIRPRLKGSLSGIYSRAVNNVCIIAITSSWTSENDPEGLLFVNGEVAVGAELPSPRLIIEAIRKDAAAMQRFPGLLSKGNVVLIDQKRHPEAALFIWDFYDREVRNSRTIMSLDLRPFQPGTVRVLAVAGDLAGKSWVERFVVRISENGIAEHRHIRNVEKTIQESSLFTHGTNRSVKLNYVLVGEDNSPLFQRDEEWENAIEVDAY